MLSMTSCPLRIVLISTSKNFNFHVVCFFPVCAIRLFFMFLSVLLLYQFALYHDSWNRENWSNDVASWTFCTKDGGNATSPVSHCWSTIEDHTIVVTKCYFTMIFPYSDGIWKILMRIQEYHVRWEWISIDISSIPSSHLHFHLHHENSYCMNVDFLHKKSKLSDIWLLSVR